MNRKNLSIPQPDKTTFILHLIREELKIRKFFRVLREAGIDDCYYRPHLDSLILDSLGLDDGRDETFLRYDEILERRIKKIKADDDSVMKEARNVYFELCRMKTC